MSASIVLFSAVFVIAIGFFAWSCYRRFGLLRLGRPDNRFDRPGRRILNAIYFAIMQRRVVSRPFGVNHAVLFWCFLILLIANAEFLLGGIFPDYISLSRLPLGVHQALAMIFDIVSLLVLFAVVAAIIRRVAFSTPHLGGLSRDAATILTMVAVLMLAFFGLHAAEITHGSERAASFMPVSGVVASTFLAGVSAGSLVILAGFFWWLHALVLLSFLNYLPYSKHMHVLTAIPNCYFRNLDKPGTQPKEDFKKGNTYGVGEVSQFTWKGLFDSYTCTECARCSDICPATSTGKLLDPRLMIHDIKINLLTNGPLIAKQAAAVLPLIGAGKEGSVAEEVIWDCTTCGACVQVCPVFIEHFPRIIDMRRNLVEMRAKFPEELLAFFENIEQRSNPWGIAPSDRTKWAAEIDAPLFEAGKTEYLFYVGCFGAFDARYRQVTLALTRIMDAAGISWGILGKEELCCGDSLRRLGNEYVFDQMARENVKMFNEKGVNKVITQCPHCFSTFKNDYKQYGLDIEVIHHSQLLDELVSAGRLKLDGADLGKVVFHDSCYLGRYHDIYEAPRRALARATGKEPAEMPRNREQSFCCGAGGGRMWLEESVGKNINVDRIEEALAQAADTVCVCCPYCMTMFADGLKDKNAEDKLRVLDLAEIIDRALK
ncbi:MAG: heterodisulfide reductase-related iron-sulfur binding cluster [Dehalococcoidales bacterium]|jgi:Fe-S oxidoreductase